MAFHDYNKGDTVCKRYRYSDEKFCYHGGNSKSVPLSTYGEVTNDCTEDAVNVKFDNGVCWTVHAKELTLVRRTKEENDVMKAIIAKVYEKTADAVLVQSHFAHELSDSLFKDELILREYKVDYLAEAKTREEAEKKLNK